MITQYTSPAIERLGHLDLTVLKEVKNELFSVHEDSLDAQQDNPYLSLQLSDHPGLADRLGFTPYMGGQATNGVILNRSSKVVDSITGGWHIECIHKGRIPAGVFSFVYVATSSPAVFLEGDAGIDDPVLGKLDSDTQSEMLAYMLMYEAEFHSQIDQALHAANPTVKEVEIAPGEVVFVPRGTIHKSVIIEPIPAEDEIRLLLRSDNRGT